MKTLIIDIDDLNPNNREQMDCEIFILKYKFNIDNVIRVSDTVNEYCDSFKNDEVLDEFFIKYVLVGYEIYVHITYRNVLEAIYFYLNYKTHNKIVFFGNYLNYIYPNLIKKYDDLDYAILNFQEEFDCKKIISQVNSRELSLNTFNGCPYKCEYCSLNIPYIDYKNYDVNYKEINECLGASNIESVFFSNELFFKNENDVEEFIETKNKLNYEFSCSLRAELLNKEIINLLRKGNCKSIFLGIESGSPRIRKYYRKQINAKELLHNIDYLIKNEINIICSFIISDPRELECDLNKTIELMWDIKNIEKNNKYNALIIYEINKIQFFPGSELTKKYYNSLQSDNYTIDTKYANNNVYDILKNKYLLTNYYNIKKNIDGSIDRLRNLLEYLFNTYVYIDKRILDDKIIIKNHYLLKFLVKLSKENNEQVKKLLDLHESYVYGYEEEKYNIFSSLYYDLIE